MIWNNSIGNILVTYLNRRLHVFNIGLQGESRVGYGYFLLNLWRTKIEQQNSG